MKLIEIRKEVIGMTKKEVMAYIEEHGYKLRCYSESGKGIPKIIAFDPFEKGMSVWVAFDKHTRRIVD